MICSFGGRNCWAFKDWFEVSFMINKNVPKEYGFANYRAVPFLCFEGANASGKTCAIKVLSFITWFCKDSFSYKPEAPIPYDTFFYNEEDSEFFLEFVLPDNLETTYTYETVFTKGVIRTESLTSKKGKEKRTIFKREGNLITKSDMGDIKGKNFTLRDNASTISTLYQYGVASISPIISFFTCIKTNVAYPGRQNEDVNYDPAYIYQKDPELLQLVIKEMKRFDIGISDIKILEYQKENNEPQYYSVIYHDTEDGPKPLNHWSLSTGSKVIYSKLLELMTVLATGGVMLFDEMDCHLHSDLAPLLLSYFTNSEWNPKNAQLVFTSHDSGLLDEAKKYRSYLFKKDKGESICYRIDELSSSVTARNDRSLQQLYIAGLLGGTPIVKAEE